MRCNFFLGEGKSEFEDDDSEEEKISDSFESELVQSDSSSEFKSSSEI